MTAPDCSRHAAPLSAIAERLSQDRAAHDLGRYLRTYRGARFDRLADHLNPDEFTEGDFQAVQQLSVSVLLKARSWFRGDGRDCVRALLSGIPAGRDIWEIEPSKYSDVLGPGSPAWRLWELVTDQQRGAGSAGRWVTAGKLLHAKRPHLIPIFDRKRTGALGVTQRTVWEVMWCALRTPAVHERVADLRASVDESAALSLLRVMDIVLWMSGEPPCPPGAACVEGRR